MLGRLKFDITALVDEILDRLPVEVWTSSVTKFLDPAIGGGQFVHTIENRLRTAGHSDKNIAARVYGYESNRMRINFAVNKYKLVGTYINKDFLKEEVDMKFDVIVGNPPYQSGNGEKGGARSLWRKFIKKSFELIGKDGYVALVCPGFPHNTADLGTYFTNNTPLILENDATSYFPTIGSEIKYWVVQEGKHNKDFIVDGKKWIWAKDTDPTVNSILTSIFQKTVFSNQLFNCKQDRGYSSTQLKNDDNDYFEKPKGDSVYPIRHASNVKICYVKKPTECHTKRKVMMTFSGYPGFEYYDENTPMSSCYQMSGYIEVDNDIEAKLLISLYSTKLYTFLSQGIRSAGMKSIVNYSLPKVDLNKSWTDADLYKHFKLTQEEIKYVESNN